MKKDSISKDFHLGFIVGVFVVFLLSLCLWYISWITSSVLNYNATTVFDKEHDRIISQKIDSIEKYFHIFYVESENGGEYIKSTIPMQIKGE